MRKYICIISLIALCGFASCGESAEQRRQREAAEAQRVSDSIANVEAARAKLEQRRLDSIASVEKRLARMAADSAVRAELLPSFTENVNADESGASLYMIKGTPTNHRQNTAYLSFRVDNGSAREIYLNVSYFGSDWLLINRAVLLIDGDSSVDLTIPDDVPGDVNSDATCSEWFTTQLYSDTLDKIMDAKSISVELTGENNTKTIKLNPTQVAQMPKTIKLFRAFGG